MIIENAFSHGRARGDDEKYMILIDGIFSPSETGSFGPVKLEIVVNNTVVLFDNSLRLNIRDFSMMKFASVNNTRPYIGESNVKVTFELRPTGYFYKEFEIHVEFLKPTSNLGGNRKYILIKNVI